MKPNPSNHDKSLKIVGVLLPSLPFLGYRLLREYLRFKTSANKAGKIFEQELIKQGLSLDVAQELTLSYLESRNLQNTILSW
ncbi:MAG: hypothetical protein KKC68_00870 [Candidatus Thermoplasmatota archaeon]|nr:hypothetical protein [Candidatus Thermoplasmatota archaeon]MBU1940303.1 hypothetical protein [Candidatus Thermoplasmatota archaeon]